MTDGEKMVWAVAFVTAIGLGKYPQQAALWAAKAVDSMRVASQPFNEDELLTPVERGISKLGAETKLMEMFK